nr:hypothetical protein CFP56_69163 [Quercus suber]
MVGGLESMEGERIGDGEGDGDGDGLQGCKEVATVVVVARVLNNPLLLFRCNGPGPEERSRRSLCTFADRLSSPSDLSSTCWCTDTAVDARCGDDEDACNGDDRWWEELRATGELVRVAGVPESRKRDGIGGTCGICLCIACRCGAEIGDGARGRFTAERCNVDEQCCWSCGGGGGGGGGKRSMLGFADHLGGHWLKVHGFGRRGGFACHSIVEVVITIVVVAVTFESRRHHIVRKADRIMATTTGHETFIKDKDQLISVPGGGC